MPSRRMIATASARLRAPTLSRIAVTWNLAVCTEMSRCRAITLFEAPSSSSSTTCRSRWLSGACASTSSGSGGGITTKPAACNRAAAAASSGSAIGLGAGSAARALADGNIIVADMSTTAHSQFDVLSDAAGAEPVRNIGDAGHRLTVPCGDDVADQQAGLRRRALALDAEHDRAAAFAHRMQHDAQPAARHITFFAERRHRLGHRGRGDHQRPAADAGHAHADELAVGRNDGAALRAPAGPEVERD